MRWACFHIFELPNVQLAICAPRNSDPLNHDPKRIRAPYIHASICLSSSAIEALHYPISGSAAQPEVEVMGRGVIYRSSRSSASDGHARPPQDLAAASIPMPAADRAIRIEG